MRDTTKMDKYKVYGELINTYGYNLEEGCKSFQALNYYTNEEITIPLDATMTPQENAKKYFERYNKLKRTAQALEEQIADTESEILHLESIQAALDIARQENDLSQIKASSLNTVISKNIPRITKRKCNPNLSLCIIFPVTVITFMSEKITIKMKN